MTSLLNLLNYVAALEYFIEIFLGATAVLLIVVVIIVVDRRTNRYLERMLNRGSEP